MKAYNITTNLLQAHPDLKGIMCANDVMALAAVEAIEAAGKKGQVIVVGIDLIPQGKEAIDQGRLTGSVAFSPFVIGELCTRAAIAAVMGKRFLMISMSPVSWPPRIIFTYYPTGNDRHFLEGGSIPPSKKDEDMGIIYGKPPGQNGKYLQAFWRKGRFKTGSHGVERR